MGQLVKNPLAMWETWVGDMGSFNIWVGKIPWRKKRLCILIFEAREFHGLYSPLVAKGGTRLSDFHFHTDMIKLT